MENHHKKLMFSLVAHAAQRDIPAGLLLRSSNITFEEMHDLSAPLSTKQISDIWLNAIRLTKDNLFGLHFGESLQLAALGVVGEIIKTSETVGDALISAARLTHLISETIRLEVIKMDQYFSVLFIPIDKNWRQDVVTVQMLDLLLVLVIHELDGLMLQKLSPTWASHAGALTKPTEYERVLRCRPETSADSTELRFDNTFWNERIITSNYQHQKLLLEQAGITLSIDSKQSRLADRISNYLTCNSYMGMIMLEDIASNFAISPRTLQRRLRQEGISFQQLTDEVRKTQALAYLQEGSYLAKEISYLLGYNELSAFTRTFKRWTGQTPAAYRQNFLNCKLKPGKIIEII
ncbi:AraC family transcriptional regulator [Dyadobacter sp. CY326]|uniref:AraC family transcriptional regulator n=1 Tax=Dyadobacter sp. CY326 TaxID=2907300 RepID=UPI001F23FE8F|nr:AraC family transcriptional regulator [Dyadobacter sp. CY326]MCE7065275.1 AraC family transcriptional regulator [Dyadobacter sp. CY326]